MRRDVDAESRDASQTTSRQTWLPLIAVSIVGLIMVFNVATLTTAIGDIVVSLNAPVSSVQWAIVGYSLLVAAFTVTGGKLSAVLGSRSTELLGLAVYAVGTAITASADSVRILALGQAISGLGGALLIPNSVAIIMQVYSGRQREIAVAIQAALTGIGALMGLLFGGTLISMRGWRAPFIALLVMQVIAFFLVSTLRLPKTHVVKAKIDLPSVALSAIGIVIVTGAVNQIGPWGLLAARPGAPVNLFGISPALLMLVGGGLVLKLFITRQRHLRSNQSTPLLAPEIVESKVTRSSLVALVAASLLLAGVGYLMLLYTQVVLHYSALRSALSILPLFLAAVIAAVAAPVLMGRCSPRSLVGGAVLLGTASTILLAAAVSNTWNKPAFWAAEILVGLSVGVVLAVGGSVVVSSAPDSLSSDVGSAQGVASFIGTALGTAVAGAVLLVALASTASDLVERKSSINLPPSVELSPTSVAFVSNDELRNLLSKPPWHLTNDQLAEAVEINVNARLAALRSSLVVLALLVFVAIGVVGSIPGPRPKELETKVLKWPVRDHPNIS